jgi:hypothetical protein
MGLSYNSQIHRRWGHYRKASTQREKDNWEVDFARAEAVAPKPPVTPRPAPAEPEPRARVSQEAVFATLREKLGNL